MKSTLSEFYEIEDIHDFILINISDSTEVMRKIARDLGVPHFPCLNHNLALDIKDMDKEEKGIKKQSNSPISIPRS